MEVREQAFKDYKKGMKYKDIAEKYGVSLSAVKSWASRHWKKDKVATSKTKKSQPEKKSQPKPRGAPKGNKNAVGNKGGAPLGSQNALKHGGYSAVYWDTLDEEERELIESTPTDEEQLLIEQIRLFSVRERRIMAAINKYRNMKGGLAVSGVISSHTKREFDNKEEKELYEDLRRKKIGEEKISYLGHDKFTQTMTEASINIVQRLEAELTRVQRAKTQCISELAKHRLEKENPDSKEMELIDDWISAIEDGDTFG